MPDQAFTCALCMETDATVEYEPTGELRGYLETVRDVDPYPRPVIPLCADCEAVVAGLEDDHTMARTPDEQDAVREEMRRLTQRLSVSIIEEATE